MDQPPLPSAPRPLIVTLGLDSESQAWSEEQRREHFPSALNYIPAHVSLFHALPGEEELSVRHTLERVAGGFEPFAIPVEGLMQLGRGVAYRLKSPELQAVYAELRQAWLPWLSPQDRQGFRPHVVVQNKVQPEQARALYATLAATFVPRAVRAEALLLWRYEGGPWTALAQYRFSSALGFQRELAERLPQEIQGRPR